MDVKNIKGMRKKRQNKKPPFRIYNTLSKKIEDFKPLVPGKVGMYVCGVTAYDFSHIGHARAAVVFDILFRSASSPFHPGFTGFELNAQYLN